MEYTSVGALRAYFGDSTRPLELAELKGIGANNIRELGALAAVELGGTIKV